MFGIPRVCLPCRRGSQTRVAMPIPVVFPFDDAPRVSLSSIRGVDFTWSCHEILQCAPLLWLQSHRAVRPAHDIGMGFSAPRHVDAPRDAWSVDPHGSGGFSLSRRPPTVPKFEDAAPRRRVGGTVGQPSWVGSGATHRVGRWSTQGQRPPGSVSRHPFGSQEMTDDVRKPRPVSNP